jgi:hypothetical protein
MPVLLDSGPSPRGFHRLEAFLRCPTLYWWKYVRGVKLPTGDPLVRGTIGHVGLAHYYGKIGLTQRGEDPDYLHTVDIAMQLVANKHGDQGQKCHSIVRPLVWRHNALFAHDAVRYEIVGVEKLLETSFEGYRYTARADLIVKDKQGLVWILDHKIVGRIEDRVFKRYAASGQFHGLAHLGRRLYGDQFGGCLMNVIGVDGKIERRAPEPAPWLYSRWPSVVAQTEREIERLTPLPIEEWPAASSEVICVTPYGLCDFFDACRWGPAE